MAVERFNFLFTLLAKVIALLWHVKFVYIAVVNLRSLARVDLLFHEFSTRTHPFLFAFCLSKLLMSLETCQHSSNSKTRYFDQQIQSTP